MTRTHNLSFKKIHQIKKNNGLTTDLSLYVCLIHSMLYNKVLTSFNNCVGYTLV